VTYVSSDTILCAVATLTQVSMNSVSVTAASTPVA
jgi:hypothetical protein